MGRVIFARLRRVSLTQWILIAMAIGVLIGAVAPDFAVKLKHKTEHAVGRGMLGPKVDREIAGRRFRHGETDIS